MTGPGPTATGIYARSSRLTTVQQCLAASALSAAGVFVAYYVAVRTWRGQALELLAIRGRFVQPPGVRGAAPDVLQSLSVGSVAIVMVMLLALALVRGDRLIAAVTAAVVAGAFVSTEVLKHWVFTRPQLMDDTVQSYPSGHSTVALSVVVAAIFVQSPRRRTIAAVIGVPCALAIGTATVLAGWHRPSDVFGAWLVVGAWSFAGIAVLRTRSPRNDGRSVPSLTGLTAVFGLFLLTLGAVTLVGLRQHISAVRVGGRLDAAKQAVAFGVSMSTVALTAVVVVALVLHFLRPAASEGHTS